MSDEVYKKRDDEDDERPSNDVEDEDQRDQYRSQDQGVNDNLKKT